MNRNFLIRLVLALGIVFVLPVSARSWGNLHLGKLQIRPTLSVGHTYSDNVLQQSTGSDEDITEVGPGLELRFPVSSHLFRLSYDPVLYNFKNASKTKFKNSAGGSVSLNFPVGLSLSLSDTFAQRVYPTSPELAGIIENWTNDGNAEIGYSLTQRWSIFGLYKNEMLRYQNQANAADTNTNSGGISLNMRVTAKISLFGEGWLGKVGYRNDNYSGQDATFARGFLGLSGKFTPKSGFNVKAGYENRSYQDSALPKISGLVASLSVEEKPSTRLSFSLNGIRSINESIYDGNTSYTLTGGGASLTIAPIPMINLGADFNYNYLAYPNENSGGIKRNDKTWNVSPNGKFDITRWLYIRAIFTLSKRDSNIDNFDYTENKIQGTLNAAF